MPSKKLIVGLTGGIGSGKSTVARYFEALGVGIVDADRIAHEVVREGSVPLAEILNHFGPDILTEKGKLDRTALGRIIFQNSKARAWLETLLHPLIRKQIRLSIKNLSAPYGIVVIPLLVESGHFEDLNRILVVDVPEEAQIQRAMKRDGLTEAQVRAILKTQASRQERLAVATDVIVNDGDLVDLEKQIMLLHCKYSCYGSPPSHAFTSGSRGQAAG